MSPPITTDGATDVVLDWFEANNLVKSYNGEWVTVQCPWHKSHTTGEDTAGYSPLGYGEGQTRNFRGFHCFHEHCGDRHAADLIDLLVDGEQIPFHVPVYDPVWQWKVKLVLDVENSKIIDLTTMERLPLASFSVTRPHVVIIDEKKVPLHKLYLNSPDKLQVSGSRYAPSETWPIFKSSEGLLHVNSYHTPRWGTGAFKQEVADVFINHLKYLCPTPEEFAYVMNWIVCKAHNPKFRGNAIIMYAPSFGTGRDTLVKMLEKVFHSSNIVNISSKVLLDPNYNMFLESQFVVCNELTDGARDRSHYRAFEHLKDLVDPHAKHTLINRKYEKQYMAPVYSSFLMFTNHNDAVKMAEGDRRFYVVSNPTRPAPPSYFQSIHASLNDPSFGMHVWRWLKTQTPDYKKGEEPVPMTVAKEVMLKEADSPEVIALREFLNVLDCDIVVTTTVIELIEREPVLAALFDIGTPWGLRKKQLTKALKGLTKGVDRYIPAAKLRTVYSETSTLTRYRVMSDAGEWTHGEIKFDDDRLDAIEDYRLRMAEIAADRTAFVNEVVDAVNALDNY